MPRSKTEKRPVGIPTYEDKIARKAVQMVLEPIYEQQLHDFSYGFRPGKSQHKALDRLWQEVKNMRGAYVIDLDISKYFDTIDHKLLREVVRKRVRDGVIMRMTGEWLHPGVMEGGTVTYPKAGSPQGGVISPVLLFEQRGDLERVMEVTPETVCEVRVDDERAENAKGTARTSCQGSGRMV